MSIGPGLIGSSVVIQVKRKQWRLDFSTPGRRSGVFYTVSELHPFFMAD